MRRLSVPASFFMRLLCALACLALLAAGAPFDSPQTEAVLLERVRQNPGSFEANHQLGEFYLAQNKLKAGIPYLQRAHAIKPTDSVNSYDLALAWVKTGKTSEARDLVTEMLRASESAEWHNLLGDIEAADQHIEEAARQYEIAARTDPSEKNLFDLGSFLQSHRGFEQARTVFGYAAGKYPKSAQFQVGLGVAYYSLGQYREAVQALCRAVDINPKDTKALDFLGKMYDISPEYAGEVTKRLAHFVEIYPHNAAANFYYGLSLRKRNLGGGEEALRAQRYLARAVELNPQWGAAHFELGLLYEDRHETAKAIREYEAAIAIEPDALKAHYRLATLYRQAGKADLARREYRVVEALKAKQPVR